MKTYEQKCHPLLKEVSEETAAVALGLFVLVFWSGMFPLTILTAISWK